MAPSKADVHAMVAALFTLTAGMERARRQRKAAAALSLLQLVAGRQPIRPSEIADLQDVHPSLVTRQVRELEDAGHVQVAADPADGRSCLVTLTPAGTGELRRLTQPAWTGSPCSWPTGSPAMCAHSPRCWTSSGIVSPPSLSKSRSNARTAVAGQAPPGRISGTHYLPPNGGLRAHQARRDKTAVGSGTNGHENPASPGAGSADTCGHLTADRPRSVTAGVLRATLAAKVLPGRQRPATAVSAGA